LTFDQYPLSQSSTPIKPNNTSPLNFDSSCFEYDT
jgi:hypothetical protein